MEKEKEIKYIVLKCEMESIDCEVCYHQFDENGKAPRTMNCGHSLCTECMDREISSGQIKCPFCRKEQYVISANDIPITYSLLKVVKVMRNLEVSSSIKLETQDGDKRSVSPDLAIEPNLHAGVCEDHGSYKLFWCKKCRVWVCRDCTVLDHPTRTCLIVSVSKAFTLLKEEENKSTSEIQTRRDNHISVIQERMSALLKRKEEHNSLLERYKKLIDNIRREIAELEKEYERVNISICNSNSLNEEMVHSNEQLANAVTVDELMLLQTKTQQCRLSVENWVVISQRELEANNILKITKERQTIMDWALKVSSLKTLDVTKSLRIMPKCIQEAVTEGTVMISILTKLNPKLTIWSKCSDSCNEVVLLTPHKDGVCLHTTCKGYPSANSIKLPYSNLMNLTYKRIGFVTLKSNGKIFGPVHFRMDVNCTELYNIQCLLTGQGIRLLVNSELVLIQSEFYFDASDNSSRRIYKCYGITIGATYGERGSLEDLLEISKVTKNRSHSIASNDVTNNEVSEEGLYGWVTSNHINGMACFTIWYKEEELSYSYYGSGQEELPEKLGRVVEGIEAIKELAKEPSSYNYNKIVKKVVDCGLYCQDYSFPNPQFI